MTSAVARAHPGGDAALWEAYLAERSTAARDALFAAHFGLARAIARRRFGGGAGDIELADLLQLASAGLLEAIDRYDPGRGVPFRSYAARRIGGSILDGIARMSELREQAAFRNRARSERLRSLRAGAETAPDAEAALRAVTEMAIGLALGFMLEGTSLYAGEGGRDHRADAYESLCWKRTVERLRQEVALLPDRERRIILDHYGRSMSFDALAAGLGLSKGRVSQLHRAALALLRKRMHGHRFEMRR